jgi:Fe-S-cluster containining protein
MECRPACGACCTAPSITSAIPGMPNGKPAGVPCVQLDEAQACRIFGHPERPAVCASIQPSSEMCGHSRDQAMLWLARLESATTPHPGIKITRVPKVEGRIPG